jgi:hypothetical protein
MQPKPSASDPSGVGKLPDMPAPKLDGRRLPSSCRALTRIGYGSLKRDVVKAALPEGSAARGLRLHRKMPDAERPRRVRGGNPCKCHVSVFGARGESCSGKIRGRGARRKTFLVHVAKLAPASFAAVLHPAQTFFVIRGESCSHDMNRRYALVLARASFARAAI